MKVKKAKKPTVHWLYNQESYTNEALERIEDTSEVEALRLTRNKENWKIPHEYRLLIENAYRRGYQQGVEAASRNKKIKRDKVYSWRYKQHGGAFEHPPE